MSFLAPLYALGALAIVAPIIFHLIRRTPSGEIPFSSLMFLNQSPPRLSKRSRLDQILLLLLRAAALGLLAFAFARPFLRAGDRIEDSASGGERQRVALLIDTSASMRRGNLWSRAMAMAEELLSAVRPEDQLAIYAFDRTSRTILGFDESATLDPQRRLAIARARLGSFRPSWGSTQLGQALVDVVTAINDMPERAESFGGLPRRVVLIGDLQQGSRTDALGEFEWPSDIELELRSVTDDASNAGLHGIADTPSGEVDPEAETSLRVRVSNDAGNRDAFTLAWAGDDGLPLKGETSTPAYVPPGESRVIRVPRPKETKEKLPTRLVLQGDQRDFDNTLHLAERPREEVTVLYLGKDADSKVEDPSGLLYYLKRAFVETPRRRIKVVAQAPADSLAWDLGHPPALVVLAGTRTGGAVTLRTYIQGGGSLLIVLTESGQGNALATVAGVPEFDMAEARVSRDAILGEIAFDHPLFAPFAAPQFNDFTKTHFWKYRKLDPRKLGDEVRVLAKFENGDPALLEKPLDKGRLIVMTSGWNPVDSQLARSSKFVPLMMSLAERRDRSTIANTRLLVGDRLPLPKGSGKVTGIRKPDGTHIAVAARDEAFSETDMPGLYKLETSTGEQAISVNLDPLESRVAPLNVETLEQLGCRLAKPTKAKTDPEVSRLLQNAELEGRQKFWRWLILAAIVFLIAETWLSGRLSRHQIRSNPAEVLAS